MNLSQELAYRAKAIAASAGLAAVGVVEWLVSNPDTAVLVQHIIPAPYTQAVPIILGAIGVFLVHQWPNAEAPASSAASVLQEPPTDTTIVRLSSINGGEFVGPAAH